MTLKRIKGIFTYNVGLKLMAVIFAFVLWLLVVNIDDPTQSQNFTARVTVLNEDVLTSQGKYYNIADGENTVTFRVTAKRSVIERLSNSDFTATADMNLLENDSRIPIEVTANRYASSLTIAAKARYLSVEIGEEMSAKYMVSAVGDGEPAAGYIVDSLKVTPNVINVDGPSEIVSLIDRVVATCDIDGMSTDITENVVPVFYDADGNTIDTTKLSLNVSTVEVAAKLTNIKTVTVDAEVSGEPAEGMLVDTIEVAPAAVSIKGSASLINPISKVTIPAEAIDITGVSDRFETTVDINSYLPDGVSVAYSSEAQITVAVTMSERIERSYSVPTANIEVRNLGEGLELSFDDTRVDVTIYGTESALSELSAMTLTGYIDAEGATEGEQGILINFDIGDRYVVLPTQALVTITDGDDENDTTTSNNAN